MAKDKTKITSVKVCTGYDGHEKSYEIESFNGFIYLRDYSYNKVISEVEIPQSYFELLLKSYKRDIVDE